MNRELLPGRKWLVTALSCLLLAACATPPKAPEPREPEVEAADTAARWWQVAFRIHWPEEAPLAWHMGPLLAHRVAGPALLRHEQSIPLWRFHRRAARDDAGHQFSLIFYASPATARVLFSEIEQVPLLEALTAAGDVETVRLQERGQAIAATSDAVWNPAIQRSWPWFIMGVSRSWLELIDQVAGALPESASLEQTHAHYREAVAEVTALWQQQGGHAYLHHLNAVFGYEPLMVRF